MKNTLSDSHLIFFVLFFLLLLIIKPDNKIKESMQS